MQASGIGLVLGFFFLYILDLKDFAQGKAFPEDEDEYKYRYNQKLKNQFQPIYKRNVRPKLYYPHIDGKPIFLPAVTGSASHVNKLFDDHYERNKEYSQSWTFTSPATYDYDHSNQKDYYEDSVTSNSMITNLLDAYEIVHHSDYHVLSSTPESYASFESKQKNKSNKQNLRKKDKRRKNNRDFHDISKDPNYTKSKFESVSPGYVPGLTEVIGKKFPIHEMAEDLVDINISDYDYASEETADKELLPEDYDLENVGEKKFSNPDEAVGVKHPDYLYDLKEMNHKELSDDYTSGVEVISKTVFHAPGEGLTDSKLTDDYSPEVVKVIGSKLTDDYSPEVVKVVGSKLTDDYSPEVVKVVGSKLTDDYSPEVVKVVGSKLTDDYSPEVVKVVGSKITDDYSPEVVKVVGSKITDDYSPEVVKVVGSKLTDDYSPEVVKVVGSKLTDDYSPEVVKETGMNHPKDKSIEVEEKFSFSPEVKKVINIKHKTEQLYLPKKKLLNTDNKDYEEVASKEPFTSKDKIKIKIKIKSDDKIKIKSDDKIKIKSDDKIKIKSDDKIKIKSDDKIKIKSDDKIKIKSDDKIKIKSDKKRIKVRSPDNKASSDVHKLENKKSKIVHKNKSQKVKSETRDPNGYLISIKKNSHSKPIDMNSGKLDHKKTEYSVKRDDDFKETSNKIKPTMTPKNEYLTHKTHKVRVKDDLVTDSSTSSLGKHRKTTSTHESTTDLSEDESREKMEDNSRDLLIEKPFDSDESFEAFDLESPGSGDGVNSEDARSDSLFSDVDFPRSLSTLNSNVWSLIFNPNAEFKKVKKCITRSNEPGFCMYVQQCDIPNVVTSLEQLLQDACVIDDIFVGICCPEFPVQTVKVHWEQMPSDTDKRTDDFAHKSDGELIKFWCAGYEESLTNLLNNFSLADCGIRSDAALKAQSWPWKAPLVSMSNGRIFCDGVLITDNYVLTAAHCTRRIPKNQILVRLGQFDESSGEDYAVVEIKRHAQYNRRSMLNDIALLKLGRRIRHDEHTNRICIPDDDDDDDEDDDHHDHEDDHAGEKAILLGSRGSFNINSKKDERLEVMTNKECEKKLGMRVPATMLCTEARNENERSCNTDSGAPLIIEDDDKYEVIGILSWNRNDCDPRFPSIFSRVSKYVGWIREHTV